MKWNRLTDAAKKAADRRGGADGLKRDAEKLREIATGRGTAKEKAQRAAEHLKQQPRKPGDDRPEHEQKPGDRPG